MAITNRKYALRRLTTFDSEITDAKLVETTAPLNVKFTTASTETESYFDITHDSMQITISGYNGTDAWRSLNTGFVEVPSDIIHNSDIVNIELERDTGQSDDNMGTEYYINIVELRH